MARLPLVFGLAIVVSADSRPLHAAEPPTVDPLAAAARAVLATHCYRCHGENGVAEGGFNTALDRGRLVAGKKVVPGKPSKSPLYKRVASLEMPPEDEEARPTESEVSALRRWIEAGALDWSGPRSRRAISVDEEARLVREDLGRFGPTTARPLRGRDIKYFTLTPLYNAGYTDDELQTARLALAKLLNGLSWHPDIVLPEAINPERTLYRIDLADFGWDRRHWEFMVRLGQYNAEYRPDLNRHGEPLPLRADVFVAEASRPPRYHDVLGIPLTVRELEGRLKLDAAANIRAGKVIRAGFGQSGVSRHNRMIERHEGLYGYYWKSYDFAASRGRRSVLTYPLGPGASADDVMFQHDGGEIIFRLPNGLQGYMLTGPFGDRLDRGPTTIVSDPKHPDRVVENGVSCLSCHSGGFLDKADQVRGLAEAGSLALSQGGLAEVLRLYPPRPTFEAALQADAEDYRQALTKLGIKPGGAEPINVTARRFEMDLDLNQAAAELWLEPEVLVSRLRATPAFARGELTPLLEAGGTVKREAFTAYYKTSLHWLQKAVLSTAQDLPTTKLPKPTQTVELLPGDIYLLAELHPAAYDFPPPEPCPTVDPSFRWIASVTAKEHHLRLHDLATGQLRHQKAEMGAVHTFKFSPDGELLAVSAERQPIGLIETRSGRELYEEKAPQNPPNANGFDKFAFRPDGKVLLGSLSRTQFFRLFEPKTSRVLATIPEPDSSWGGLEYTTDGGRLLTATGGRFACVRILDVKTGKATEVDGFEMFSLKGMQVSPDGQVIALGFVNSTLRLRDAATLDEIALERLKFQDADRPTAVMGLGFRPDSRLLATIHLEGAIGLWTVPGLRLLGAFRVSSANQLRTVCFSPDGRRLATGSADGSVHVWDVEAMSKAND